MPTPLEKARLWLRAFMVTRPPEQHLGAEHAQTLLAATEPIPPGELAEAMERLDVLTYCWESPVHAQAEREDAAAIRKLIRAVRQQPKRPEADLYSEAVKARVHEACWVAVQAYIQSDLTRFAATGEAIAAGLRAWETTGTMAAFLPEQPEADPEWAEALARLESAAARSDMDIDDIRLVCRALRR